MPFKKLTTKSFRETVLSTYPMLLDTSCNCTVEQHLEMMRIALFSSFKCEQTGAIRFGAETVARAYDKLTIYNSGRFAAGTVLKHFISLLNNTQVGTASLVLENGREWVPGKFKRAWEVDPADYEEYKLGQGQKDPNRLIKVQQGIERRVIFNWPAHIQAAIQEELTIKVRREEKVYFTTGRKYNQKLERQELNTLIEECIQEVEILDCPTGKSIAKYMNYLPVNSFNKLIDNAEEAFALIDTLRPEVRDQQLKILNAVLESPKPVYKPSKSGNTDRLFGDGANITNLKKEVRKVLTKGWVECDARNIHLAIVAKMWDVKEVKAFLATGQSFWTEVLSFMKLGPEAKSVIKDHTYALIYGMALKNIKAGIDNVLGEGYGAKFLSHPIVKAIKDARNKAAQYYVLIGLIIDAFGKELKVTKENVLTQMSRVSQSYEQVMIHSIYELAKQTEDFTICLYQFDGLSIKFHSEERQEFWIRKIDELFQTRCNELDILSSLSWDLNGHDEVPVEERQVKTIEFAYEIPKAYTKVTSKVDNVGSPLKRLPVFMNSKPITEQCIS